MPNIKDGLSFSGDTSAVIKRWAFDSRMLDAGNSAESLADDIVDIIADDPQITRGLLSTAGANDPVELDRIIGELGKGGLRDIITDNSELRKFIARMMLIDLDDL